MNVRIFWVRAMKCMCAQTRPRFILSSEGVFGGMEFEPMLTPREKSPLPENFPRGGSNLRHCGQRAQALPTELFRPGCYVWSLATWWLTYACQGLFGFSDGSKCWWIWSIQCFYHLSSLASSFVFCVPSSTFTVKSWLCPWKPSSFLVTW